MNKTIFTLLAISIITFSNTCLADLQSVCSNSQKAQIIIGKNQNPSEEWTGMLNQIKSVKLSNGFLLGVKIEPAENDFYKRYNANQDHLFGFVRISLYDYSKDKIRPITYTYAPANSQQGYSSKGGANKVPQAGDDGITIKLINTDKCDNTNILGKSR